MLEALNEELVDHFDETTGLVHHPLLIMSLTPSLVGRANSLFENKREQSLDAFENKRWDEFVFLHERPYRVAALIQCVSAGLEKSAYWHLIGKVWCDSENIFQNKEHWSFLWEANQDLRSACMTKEEQDFLASLSWPQNIWRGSSHPIDQTALSWTLDRDHGIWFAKRNAKEDGRSYIASAVVNASDVLACFLRRNERELICKFVTVQTVDAI